MPSSDKRRRSARRAAARETTLFPAVMIALAVLVLVACWRYGTRPVYEADGVSPDSPGDVDTTLAYLSIKDVDRDTASDGARTVLLEEAEGDVLIDDGAVCVLRGRLDGTVRVNAPEQTVHLVLDGVDLRARSGSAILVEAADRVIITLAEGSKNRVTDASYYPPDAENDGCIYAPCALTFNGTGRLEVTGLYQDAIRSKDRVKIVDGDYRIEAKRTAIRGNDGVRIDGGTLFLGAEDDAVRTTKSGSEGRGALVITGGTLSVVAGRYAFCVEKAQLCILGCSIRTNAAAGDFHVHGTRYVEEGCLQ